ncbi:MAG: ribulose-phosphate 3-epimerase [Candidatus Omnitrophica bacterium]|nr:ribulose-phosphate 3-epimerase [Candidatus Omnitrophota bacterium]
MVKIAASILNADFGNLGQEIKRAEEAGAQLLHLDIMDGHFVPNLTLGPQVVKSLRPQTRLSFEAHLMVTNPEKFSGPFIEAGSDLILFHLEVIPKPEKLLEEIKARGVKAGLVLNPDTPAETILPYLDALDQVLVMSVNPGFGGQEFIVGALDKISMLDAERRKRGLSFEIEVDGGVNPKTGALCRKAGADILVVGTYLFRAKDIKEAIKSLQM